MVDFAQNSCEMKTAANADSGRSQPKRLAGLIGHHGVPDADVSPLRGALLRAFRRTPCGTPRQTC